jgi:hypothetical protein
MTFGRVLDLGCVLATETLGASPPPTLILHKKRTLLMPEEDKVRIASCSG